MKEEREKAKERKEEKPNCENSVSARTRGKTAVNNNNKRARACEDDDLAVKHHKTAKRQKVKEADADADVGAAMTDEREQPEKSNLSAVVRAMRKSRKREV